MNEFDYDAEAPRARLFQDNYLASPRTAPRPIDYPYSFVAPSNTGVPSGFDLDNNGDRTTPAPLRHDAFGFGAFQGQFGMAVYSKYPIDADDVRTFQHFLWKDMPGALLPDDPATPAPADWYSPEELASSGSRPRATGTSRSRSAARRCTSSSATRRRPSSTGPRTATGPRNADEIRFWADYVTPGARRLHLRRRGRRGGLHPGALFVIAGDQNSDPLDGDSIAAARSSSCSTTRGSTRSARRPAPARRRQPRTGRRQRTHGAPAVRHRGLLRQPPPGQPACGLRPAAANMVARRGVFWPVRTDELFRLTGVFDVANRFLPGQGFPASDHRAVWTDVEVPGLH